jgi:hypothetical protein
MKTPRGRTGVVVLSATFCRGLLLQAKASQLVAPFLFVGSDTEITEYTPVKGSMDNCILHVTNIYHQSSLAYESAIGLNFVRYPNTYN